MTHSARPFAFLFAAALLLGSILPAGAATYYVSQSCGNDAWSGTSAEATGSDGPWKTLAKASKAYDPGDTILLKRGDTWDEELRPQGEGTPDKPITIGAYGEGKQPVIDRHDFNKDFTGIRLSNQGGFKIVGIEFNHCMTGIYADYAKGCPTKRYLWIEDCFFHDALLYQRYEDYPKHKIGLGVCLFSDELANKVVLADITVKNCVFQRLASGFWTNSPDNFNKGASNIYNFANLLFEDCLFEEGYQWQQGIRGVDGGAMRRCVTHDVGRGFRSFNGVAGAMFFRCKDWVFEDCEWGCVDIGLGSGDGEAFDFEGNCDNMTMRNCLFHDTDGPGFLLCCYASDSHPNMKILMENCVLNGKAKRPIGLPRCEIINTTDWNETTWKNCRFYVSHGEKLMHTADPEQDKRATFVDCVLKNLVKACSTAKHEAKSTTKTEGGEAVIELDFGKPVPVNEFMLGEEQGSAIVRWAIDCWDAKTEKWVNCFNGRTMGDEFVAPIVARTTAKARLRLMQTSGGEAKVATFEAYDNTTGDVFNVARGQNPPPRPGR